MFGLWGTGWVSCGSRRVARRRVFRGGEQVGAGGKVGVVSYVNKMRINSERTLYARPVCPPAPPRRHFRCFRLLVPSWSPTVAACRVVRWWMRGTAGQHLLTRQGGHVTSPSEPNKMQNLVGDPSGCTT